MNKILRKVSELSGFSYFYIIGFSFFSILSLGTAHYVGFLVSIPKSFIPHLGFEFFYYFIGNFYLYLLICYFGSKFSVIILMSIIRIYSLLTKNLHVLIKFFFTKRHKIISEKRLVNYSFIKSYLSISENWFVKYGFLQSLLFILIFIQIYLDWSFDKFYLSTAVILFFMLIITLELIGVLLSPSHFSKQINELMNGFYRKSTIKKLTGMFLVILFCLAYLTGNSRFSALWINNEIYYHDKRFEGQLSLIMSAGSNVLAIEHSQFAQRFILFKKDYILTQLQSKETFKFLDVDMKGGN